jgi:signal transduction histidine kinase
VVRVYVLLLTGLLLSALLTAGLAWWRLRDDGQLGAPQAQAWADRVGAFVETLEQSPSAARDAVWTLAQSAGIHAGEAATPGADDPPLAAALAARLRRPVAVQVPTGHHPCAAAQATGQWHCRVVRLQLGDGRPLSLLVSESSAAWAWPPGTPHHFSPGPIPAVLLLALLVLAAAITHVTLRPMLALARGAERFGDDMDAPPIPEKGPREIRAAVAVFNRMQARIRAHLAERTSMLAAIAHDLQTPLTRLRLRLEQVEEETLRRRLTADLEECQARVREGLELARSMDDRSPIVDVELDALLGSACSEAQDAGLPVQLLGASGLVVRARPQALLRCVENLVSNAVKYGERAEVSAQADGDYALIRVRDHGPGLAPQDLERVFEPYVRGEDSRSRESGGTGLGLTIVRNLIRRQQGDVRLQNLGPPQGPGLEAQLRVPLVRRGTPAT